MVQTKTQKRCAWTGDNALMQAYHDTEWGVPTNDDRTHFEFLVLESAQAGLSWKTVLNKRENYRKVFVSFDPKQVACFTNRNVKQLLHNAGIIRNRAKIEAAINNAKKFLDIQKEFGSFAAYSQTFVDKKIIRHTIRHITDYPVVIPEAIAFAKDLKARGFKFLGPTVIYAHMQAVGMVNDHMIGCFRRNQTKKRKTGL